MTKRGFIRAAIILWVITFVSSISSIYSSDYEVESDNIRTLERERLRALVDANVDVAKQLHADNFQLINPFGESYSKEQYLGGIQSGRLDYLVWEPVSAIEVRFYGEGAVIRYQSRLQITVEGRKLPLSRYWHTDSYEKHNGGWKVVWSQATEIK